MNAKRRNDETTMSTEISLLQAERIRNEQECDLQLRRGLALVREMRYTDEFAVTHASDCLIASVEDLLRLGFGAHRITPDGEIKVSLAEFQKIEAMA
jgi:hypothetical protein